MKRLLPLLLLSLCTASHAGMADEMKAAAKKKAKAAAQQQAQESMGLPLTAPADAKVYFIQPANGAEISGPVKILFGLSGMGIAPAGTTVENTGHHHLLVDDPAVDLSKALPTSDQIIHFGKGQTETVLTLKPGKHTLQLVLGDYKHQPHHPAVLSEKIVITVK